MKKFLMVVMAMLLSLSVVAGCGGGDKKAELIKGLKTEIGTLLGNVDKLAADELKGDAAKKACGQEGDGRFQRPDGQNCQAERSG